MRSALLRELDASETAPKGCDDALGYPVYLENDVLAWSRSHPHEVFGHVLWLSCEGEAQRAVKASLDLARSRQAWKGIDGVKRLDSHPLQGETFPVEILEMAGHEGIPGEEAMVVVWAPWCMSCRESMRALAARRPEPESPCRLPIYGVCVAESREACAEVSEEWVDGLEMPWHGGYVAKERAEELDAILGKAGFSQEFLLDTGGSVVRSGLPAELMVEIACR